MKRWGLLWLTVLEAAVHHQLLHCFGSVARQEILVGVHSREKPQPGSQRERRWAGPHISFESMNQWPNHLRQASPLTDSTISQQCHPGDQVFNICAFKEEVYNFSTWEVASLRRDPILKKNPNDSRVAFQIFSGLSTELQGSESICGFEPLKHLHGALHFTNPLPFKPHNTPLRWCCTIHFIDANTKTLQSFSLVNN
jgi:hypothetical protein